MIGSVRRTRQLNVAGLALGLAVLAGPNGAHAEWPKLWRTTNTKPKIAVVASQSTLAASGAARQPTTVTPAVHESSTKKLSVTPAAAQKPVVPYEEVIELPVKSRRTETVDPCDDPVDAADSGMTLETLVMLALEQNPRLAKVTFGVESARGRAFQAGLYPNPTVALVFDELKDVQGRSGINQLPMLTQDIVMGRKLTLSRAAAEREVEQANWGVMAERYAMLAEIRTAYFDALALQERVRLLCDVRRYGRDITKTVRSLRDDAKQLADIDVLPVEAELLRYEADVESAQAEKASAYKQLAALLGIHRLKIDKVAGRFEDFSFPDYDAQNTPMYVLSVHPEIQAAQWGVEKAKLLVQRAKAEPIPNLTVNGGYVRQNQNKSDDFSLGVKASIPLWDRNQGHIRAAEAELCAAIQEVARVENDLTVRVSAALRDYAAASKRAERYRAVVAKAEQAQNIANEDQRRNLSPLMVLELQRSLRQARLERLKSLGDAWKAAATTSGLTIEDTWPPTPKRSTDIPPAPAADPTKP